MVSNCACANPILMSSGSVLSSCQAALQNSQRIRHLGRRRRDEGRFVQGDIPSGPSQFWLVLNWPGFILAPRTPFQEPYVDLADEAH